MYLVFVIVLVLSINGFVPTEALQTFHMEEGCNSLINLATQNEEAIRLKLTRNTIYTRNIDCTVAIQPPPGKNLVIKFNDMDIQQLQTGQCADFLLAIDGIDRTSARYVAGAPQQICGRNLIGSSYQTSQGYLILRFRSGLTNTASRGFDATVAAFKQGPCSANEYTCNNQRCIHENLRCSGFDLCGDGTNPCLLTSEAITGIAVGGGVLLIIIIALVVFCVCRHRKKTNFSEKVYNSNIKTHGRTNKGVLTTNLRSYVENQSRSTV